MVVVVNVGRMLLLLLLVMTSSKFISNTRTPINANPQAIQVCGCILFVILFGLDVGMLFVILEGFMTFSLERKDGDIVPAIQKASNNGTNSVVNCIKNPARSAGTL